MDKRPLEQPIRTTLGSTADVGPNDTHASIDGVNALSEDIFRFRTDFKVPERLSRYVCAPKETQVIWYKKLLEAWTQSKRLPETSEEATMLVCDTLQSLHPDAVNLEGFLYCYGLSHYCSFPKLMMRGKASLVEDDAMKFLLNTPEFTALGEALTVGEDALGFLVLNTLPVKKSRVTDGLCLGVSVEIKKFYLLPSAILSLISKRLRALAKGDTNRACTLLEEINAQDYEVVEINSEEFLAKKYSIKIRGLEESMLNRAEARDKLVKMVDNKRLRIKVAYIDDGKHFVGDVFCGDINLLDALNY